MCVPHSNHCQIGNCWNRNRKFVAQTKNFKEESHKIKLLPTDLFIIEGFLREKKKLVGKNVDEIVLKISGGVFNSLKFCLNKIINVILFNYRMLIMRIDFWMVS